MGSARLLASCALAVLVSLSCSSSDPGGSAGDSGASGDEAGGGGGDATTVGDGAGGPESGGTDASPIGVDDGGNDGTTGHEGGADGGGHPSDAGGDSADAAEPVDAAPPPASDHCASAPVIPLWNPRIDLYASTAAATHDIAAPCTADSGPDVFYQFTVSKRVFVYADTFGAGWNTVLFLLSSNCTPVTASTIAGDAVCSDDACSSSESRLVALLNPGNYRLGLGGAGGASGSATIHFEFALAASGAQKPLPQGASVQTGTTGGLAGAVGNAGCFAAGPEDAYWWATCPSDPAGTLTASTCGGATWETVLATEIPRADGSSCALDSCGFQASLNTSVPSGAGLHVLLIDGQAGSDSGPYTMNVNRP